VIGEQLGSYRVVEPIGKGGMASVFVGEHGVLGHRVAIKVLHPTRTDNPMVERRFVNEAKVVASIRHPGIVEIFDFGRGPGGRAYIVMELLRGETLRTRLRRDGPLSVGKAVVFARQIASAVAVAHDAGVIHRDLKPDNIFLVTDSEVEFGERIKVLDFGVAKQVDANKPVSEATATGVLVGTPAYMSPEQCKGMGQIDGRSDIYSLGIVMYRMLTGELPFESAATGELIGKHIFEVPPSVSELDANVPVELSALISRCLAKEPEDRYQSMHEVARELRRIAVEVLGRRAPSQVMTVRPPVVAAPQAAVGKGCGPDDDEPTTLRDASGQLSATGRMVHERPLSPWTWPLAIGGALGLGVFLALLIGSSGDQVRGPSSTRPGASSKAVESTPSAEPSQPEVAAESESTTDDSGAGPARVAEAEKEAIGPDKATESDKAVEPDKGAAPDEAAEPATEPESGTAQVVAESATTSKPADAIEPPPHADVARDDRPRATTDNKTADRRPERTRPRRSRSESKSSSSDERATKKPDRIPVPTLY
jgi:serine/threonine-protein kinase